VNGTDKGPGDSSAAEEQKKFRTKGNKAMSNLPSLVVKFQTKVYKLVAFATETGNL